MEAKDPNRSGDLTCFYGKKARRSYIVWILKTTKTKITPSLNLTLSYFRPIKKGSNNIPNDFLDNVKDVLPIS